MIARKSHNLFFALKGILSGMLIKTGLLIFCILFTSFYVKADNDETIDIDLSPILSYDEVPINFNIEGYLKFETDVIISESNKVYINIEELFKNLGVKCISENEGNNLSGFIGNTNNNYSLDFNARQIKIGNKTINSSNGIVKELGAIYLETTILEEAFGLRAIFNYRTLSIKMEADFELPVIKQMRLQQMRENISKLQDREIIADTIVEREYHLFKFGTMDWSVASYQTINESVNNIIRLGVGTELFYGQTNVSLYYNERYKFDNRNLYYNWRWVDNDKKIIKQAQLGKISYQSIAFISSPVVGGSINNSPNTVRKASGYYTINEYTEPNWTVELYINDVLIDYTVADASGLFVFKVPNVYGYTTLKLKFYGPMGEERIEERTRNVPITFMPANEFEYNLSAGVLEDGENSRFAHGDFSYGVNRFITVGGGVEYLSSITNSPFIPFAEVAIQPFNRLIVNLEYAYGVRTRGLLSYNFGRSAFLEIDYADYVDGQMAILFKPDEELKVRLSVPFKLKKVSGFAKLNYNQNAYNDFTYNLIDASFTGYYRNFSANLSGRGNWVSHSDPYMTTTLALSYRIRNGLVLGALAEYDISNSNFRRYKVEIEKRVGKAYFSVSYERNMQYQTDYVFAGLRFDLNFANVGVNAYYTNDLMVISETAQGSLAFGGDNYVAAANTSSLGKGGILLYPFLDLNQNGIFDNNEHMVLISSVKVSGAGAVISEKDSIVRITDLNAFLNYFIEFNNNDLENIGWQFTNKTYQIMVDPNQFKRVDVPIVVMGEASGMVYFKEADNTKGIGRITIQILDVKGNKVAETLSESDGYFSYLGLKPGNYLACVDTSQLRKLNLLTNPPCRKFTVHSLENGDMVNDLNFVLKETNMKTESVEANSTEDILNVSESGLQQRKLSNENVNSGKTFRIQLLASKKPVKSNEFFASITASFPNLKITESKDDDYFRYSIGVYSSKENAQILMNQIVNLGWKDCFISVDNSE